MPTKEAIQELINVRQQRLKEASEKRDANELMTWYAKDITFKDAVNDVSYTGWEEVSNFYAGAYKAIPKFKVSGPPPSGHAEFVASEMKCEGQFGIDLPERGMKAGDTLRLAGVSLFWWRWEGSGEEWDGSLSEEAIRGWKIFKEHAYVQPSAKGEGE